MFGNFSSFTTPSPGRISIPNSFVSYILYIGNRANNLYPKPWRIKTTHLPTEEIKIIDI